MEGIKYTPDFSHVRRKFLKDICVIVSLLIYTFSYNAMCRVSHADTAHDKPLCIKFVIPIGSFFKYHSSGKCVFFARGKIYNLDTSKSLYLPQRLLAQCLWLGGSSVLKYKIANPLPPGSKLKKIKLSIEVSSVSEKRGSFDGFVLGLRINGKRILKRKIKLVTHIVETNNHPISWPGEIIKRGTWISIVVARKGTYLVKGHQENTNDFEGIEELSAMGIHELTIDSSDPGFSFDIESYSSNENNVILYGGCIENCNHGISVELEYNGERIYRPKIGDIIKFPSQYAGKLVLLEVHPGGWGCPSPQSTPIPSEPIFSRSSTTYYDRTGCIYHAGDLIVGGASLKMAIPALHTLNLPGRETIVVEGRIKLDKNGVPYLSSVKK